MTLVKFKKPNTPILREPSILQDPFFSDLMNTRRSLFNLNRIFNGDNENDFEINPSMNVKDNKENYEIEMAAPGLTKDDFNITIEDGVLTVSAEKEEKSEEKQEGYLCKEFSYNTFSRSMILPEMVDENKEVKAQYKDGILKLMLHKKPEAKPKLAKTVKVS
jgi:HSP20 family protein